MKNKLTLLFTLCIGLISGNLHTMSLDAVKPYLSYLSAIALSGAVISGYNFYSNLSDFFNKESKYEKFRTDKYKLAWYTKNLLLSNKAVSEGDNTLDGYEIDTMMSNLKYNVKETDRSKKVNLFDHINENYNKECVHNLILELEGKIAKQKKLIENQNEQDLANKKNTSLGYTKIYGVATFALVASSIGLFGYQKIIAKN